MIVQVNGKIRARLEVEPDVSEQDAQDLASRTKPSCARWPITDQAGCLQATAHGQYHHLMAAAREQYVGMVEPPRFDRPRSRFVRRAA